MKKRCVLNLILFLSMAMLLSCSQGESFDTNDYNSYPVYTGSDLEMNYTPAATSFRIWAPTAEEVRVRIYETGIDGDPIMEKKMKKDEAGTWVARFNEDLKNLFYTFQIKYKNEWLDETPGIYSTAVGVNGKRGAIFDLKETNPEGWEETERPILENYNDIIIYEVQVRDLSIHPESGITNKGKFLGMAEEGTTSPHGQKTGIDHFKELGVTHIHILPAFDFRSIDETKLHEKRYNWGYDPLNYNVPEGSFSTDPYNPKTRIREFKEMVAALHRNGLRVVLDVVYNHTGYTENSNFNLLVPGYYYRQREDGSWSDASACGNETASERPMMRRFMIESLKHWVNEYKIDGFRFDLMGIHDIETMNMISKELHAIDPTIFLYGEGWKAGNSPLPDAKLALKHLTYQLDSIAAFSDDIRDGIKGSWNNHEAKGFVSGAKDLEESIKFGVVAATEHPQVDYSLINYSKAPWAGQPYQCINYVSCHDNHTLFDKLKISAPEATEAEIIKMHKLANTIVMTSQGIPFLHAGVDFLRTKKGVENSYQSPDSINQIDWERKHTYQDVFGYYRDLITLRKSHPAFRMTNKEVIQQNLEFLDLKIPGIVAFKLSDYTGGEAWQTIIVIYNSTRQAQPIDLPGATWTEVFNEYGLNVNGYRTIRNNRVNVPPISALVLAEVAN
ncbi:MAG: type I pullulanase [Bacteroidales bacterium]|nr:type I pullulanase [Bacteroidales bacterium]